MLTQNSPQGLFHHLVFRLDKCRQFSKKKFKQYFHFFFIPFAFLFYFIVPCLWIQKANRKGILKFIRERLDMRDYVARVSSNVHWHVQKKNCRLYSYTLEAIGTMYWMLIHGFIYIHGFIIANYQSDKIKE